MARRENRSSGGQTRLGNRVSVGTNATILPVTICDHVVIGAGAVVTKDIVEPGIYAGNPGAAAPSALAPPSLRSDVRGRMSEVGDQRSRFRMKEEGSLIMLPSIAPTSWHF